MLCAIFTTQRYEYFYNNSKIRVLLFFCFATMK
nr:MAG TPA: hypothetical protein [Caudoviricetes sp.]